VLWLTNTHFYAVAPYGWAAALVVALVAAWWLLTRGDGPGR